MLWKLGIFFIAIGIAKGVIFVVQKRKGVADSKGKTK